MKSLQLGDNEALAELELTGDFSNDSAEYQLHPGLLDLATGAALYLIENYGQTDSLYFPMFYKHFVAYEPLPTRFFSHIRSHQGNDCL